MGVSGSWEYTSNIHLIFYNFSRFTKPYSQWLSIDYTEREREREENEASDRAIWRFDNGAVV